MQESLAEVCVSSNDRVVHAYLTVHAGISMASPHQCGVELHPKYINVTRFCGAQMIRWPLTTNLALSGKNEKFDSGLCFIVPFLFSTLW